MEDPRDLLTTLARPVRHEANNLLSALSGTAEMMLRSRDATARDITRAERLCDAAARLQALLHGYLALAAPPPEGTPAAAVMEAMRPLVRLLLGPGHVVTIEASERLPAVPVTALQAAILRLAGQAAALTPPEGELRLRLDPAPGGALLSARLSSDGQVPAPVFLSDTA